jgi:hypothetical protein
MFSSRGQLPVELRRQVATVLGPEASVADWVSADAVCKAWSADGVDMFTEWVMSQVAESQFGYFAGSAEELKFVMDHVEGVRMHCGSEERLLTED